VKFASLKGGGNQTLRHFKGVLLLKSEQKRGGIVNTVHAGNAEREEKKKVVWRPGERHIFSHTKEGAGYCAGRFPLTKGKKGHHFYNPWKVTSFSHPWKGGKKKRKAA